MHIVHHPIFVALSVVIACLGSWTALDLFRRVRAHQGVWRRAWLAAAAIAMGLSIWSMHFIAMLGFNPGAQVRYDLGLTLLSLVLAITVTALAFFSVIDRTPRRLIAGGLVMGLGICTMHYVGMAALITPVAIENDPTFVVLAFFVAISTSLAALIAATHERTFAKRALAAIVLGAAIVGMHYTAMFGVRVVERPEFDFVSGGVDTLTLAVGVPGGTLFILFLALIAALSDRRFEALASSETLRSEQQLRAIIDNLPLGVFVAESPSGVIRLANAEAEALLGQTLPGRAIWSLDSDAGAVHGDGRRLAPEEHALYQAMHEGRRIGPRLRTFRRNDGSAAQFEVMAAPVAGRTDESALVVAAFQDVTAKLLAEESARQATEARLAQADLQRVNELLEARVAAALADKAAAEAALAHAQRLEALGRLTGGLAHDFNNLLTVVIGALDIILRHPENAARRARLGEAALAAARRGERLTGQLLAFARRQPLQPVQCDLNELIRESEPLMRGVAPDSIVLRLNLCATPAFALIDPAQFEAALLNLIVNAVDASGDGGEICIETQILVVASGEIPNLSGGRYFVARVSDTGEGMSSEVLDRIFEPFFTTKASGKGTGLGLSQLYGFVRQSGGDVRAESTPGKGSCFSIFLPVIDEPATKKIVRRTDTRTKVQPLKVLLTEDDASVAGITATMLIDLGHEVLRAANAAEALQILRSGESPDLLLSDVVMPGGMNGVQLAAHAVALQPRLKVLLNSGYAGEALDAELLKGAWPFLRKPFLAAELAAAIASLFDQPGAIESSREPDPAGRYEDEV